MNNNNSVAVIVVGLLGFVAIVITGKWLLDENEHCDHKDRIEINAPHFKDNFPRERPAQQQPAPQIIVAPPAPAPQIIIGRPYPQAYPQAYPQYHSRNEFWQGYSDGWNGMGMRQNCPEYVQGYQIGLHDRSCHRPYYHEQHCPPGFSLRVPGFSLNIR